MKKSVKWLLIGLALIAGVNSYRTVTAPNTPEEIAIREQAAQEHAFRIEADRKEAARKEAARREYFEHPVVVAHSVARKLAAISAEHTEALQVAIQSFQQYAANKGRSPINVRAVANAALAFDEMAKAYADFDVPLTLPGNTAALLTGARVDLKKSSLAGTEAFLELQRIIEGKQGSLSAVNKKMSETNNLRNKGVKALNEANAELESMTAPEYPK